MEKDKIYIVRYWFMCQENFKDINKARRFAEQTAERGKSVKEVEVIEVEQTHKKIDLAPQ